MKKSVVFLFIITLFVTHINAQDIGKVIIRNSSLSNPKFVVSLNGIRQNNQYTSEISFDFLDEYNYRVKILQLGVNGVLTYTITSAPNYVSAYTLNKDAYGNYALILESKILLSSQPVTTNTIITTNTVITTPTVSSPPNNNSNIISNQDFTGICDAITKESFESTKLEMAKTFFGVKQFSSAQAVTVAKLFSMERNKLDFAKFAYPKIIDKQSYYKMYDVFSFSSSKKELSEFIKTHP